MSLASRRHATCWSLTGWQLDVSQFACIHLQFLIQPPKPFNPPPPSVPCQRPPRLRTAHHDSLHPSLASFSISLCHSALSRAPALAAHNQLNSGGLAPNSKGQLLVGQLLVHPRILQSQLIFHPRSTHAASQIVFPKSRACAWCSFDVAQLRAPALVRDVCF